MGQYVKGCDIYQRIKNKIEILVGKSKLSGIPGKL